MKRFLPLVLVFAFLGVGVAPSLAAPSLRTVTRVKDAQTLFMFGMGGTFKVPVGNRVQTFIDFPAPFKTPSTVYKHRYFDVKAESATRLRVVPSPDAPLGVFYQVHVDFVVNSANFNFVVGDSASATEFLQVRVGTWADFEKYADELAQPRIQEANQRASEEAERASKANARAEEADARANAADRRVLEVESRALLDQLDGKPPCPLALVPGFRSLSSPTARRSTFRLLPACWDHSRSKLLMPFLLSNRDALPFAASALELDLGGGKVLRPLITYVEQRPGRAAGDVIVSVGTNESVRGVLAVDKDLIPSSMRHFKVTLREADASRWVAATLQGWGMVRSVVHAYDGYDWEREVAEEEARIARATQLIVGPRVSYGGCWLADAPGSNNVDATGCTMLGVGVTKGFFQSVAFEVSAMGGWTVDDAIQGATFGRVTLGGVLRLGQWTIPYARLGVGGQVASVAGSSEAGLVLSVGGGVDRRLGNNVVVGLGLLWDESLAGDVQFRRSVGLSAHVSVGWNINKRDPNSLLVSARSRR